jgi:ATP-binding cassette subfamily F protein uup
MAATALLSLREISVSFGGHPLLDGVDLQLEAGDRLCLLGRNGSGKSTLLRLIAGEVLPDGGEIVRQQGLRAALVSQEVPPGLGGTVFDLVAAGAGSAAHQGDEGGWRLRQEVGRIVSRLSLDAAAEFATLSGGTKRRALLARALAAAPDVLLLDEPTNHLDLDTIGWLEGFLQKEVRTPLFVTHDRAFARRLSNCVAELDRGKLYAFGCGYDAFVARREELLEAEVSRRALFDRKLAQEEAWVRQGIKARRTRNEGRVRALQALREERRARRERVGTARIRIQEAERSGRLVVEAQGASFAYDGRPVIRELTTTILAGDRVGIIGPNGSGKTTLLRLLLGELAPQHGRVRHGSRLEVRYFDQMRGQLDLDATVQQNVAEGNDTVTINGRPRHVIGYLQDFLFTPERARSPVRILSGGERNRLLLAKLFTRPANVLVMDEPTNDLDVETLELLEELLQEYAGTLLLVSHDREFLNNVVTSTLVLAGDGEVREYVGGYDDWLRQAAAGEAAKASAAPRPGPAAKAATAKAPVAPTGRARKLTFKEARELDALPERISALEAEQAALHGTLADPGYYRSAGGAVAQLNARLAHLETELGEAYRRWEELETLRG